MTPEHVLRISEASRFVLYPNSPTPRWEIYENDQWEFTHFPTIYDSSPVPDHNPVDDLKLAGLADSEHEEIQDIAAKMLAMRSSVGNLWEPYLLYENAMEDLEDFLDIHLPWSLSWEIDDVLRLYAEESFGKRIPENIDPIIRATMATMPFLTGIGNYRAVFNDGFYRVSNIDLAMDVIHADDVRDGIIKATGTYSRPLARAIKRALSDQFDVGEKATVLKLTRGLPPEYIVDIIESGFFDQDDGTLTYRGLSMNGDDPVIPDWAINQPDHRRAGWMKQSVTMFSECINLTIDNDLDISAIDFATSDIMEVHNRIIDEMISQNPVEYSDQYTYSDDVEEIKVDIDINEKELTLQTISTVEGLRQCGNLMNICVSSSTYADRLVSGMSRYVLTHDRGRPVLFAEISDRTHEIIEIKGVGNRFPTEEEEKVVKENLSVLL